MTVTAVKAQAKPTPDPVKAAGAQLAKPKSPAAPPRPKAVPLTPMRQQAAKSMRKLANQVQQSHPDMITHEHLRDAAKQVEAGNEDGAQGHLRAAMFSLTPQSLMRNGLHTDDAHQAGRQAMHSVHRRLLLVKDITAAASKNQAAIQRASYGDQAAPPHPDPDNGYGPGALAQKPTARQPPGDQALNAPARSSSGGSDPAVADPGGPQRKGSKQFTTWDEVTGAAIDLVGPGGWQHQWKPGGPTAGDHDKAAALHTAAAGKAKDPAVKAKHQRRARVHAGIARKLRSLTPAASAATPAATGLAYGQDDLASMVELSARTAMLEATPAPIGKPGGPGLYHVKGLGHSAYFEQVRNGLMKRGMPEGKASAITWSTLRRWAAGGGKVHPEVQAAARKALAEEEAKAAQAKAHAHSVTWADLDAVILEFATVIELFNPAEARVPVGSATAGQFSAGAGAQPAAGQPAGKGKAPVKPPLTKHQLHVLHVAHLLKVSTAKAALLVTAQDDKAKAEGLEKQRDALVKALASAGGKTSTGQAGAKTAATATTKTTAPATASTAAATTAASTTPAATAAKTTATAAQAAAPKAGSAAAMKAQIAQLNTQISGLLAQAAQATAQAAKLK